MKKISCCLLVLLMTVNAQSQCWKSVTAGKYHVLAIKDDDETLWGWGDNYFGQLGLDTIEKKGELIQLNSDSWSIVESKMYFSLGIKTDGSLWIWGDTILGGVPILVPIRIGTDTDWKTISAGRDHFLALKNNGSLWACGLNAYGQLGIGDTLDKNAPIQIGDEFEWAFIDAGYGNSFAIKTDGSLWACGSNSYGRLGDGTTENKSSFFLIDSSQKWKMVSGGESHTLGLTADGVIWSWGGNSFGQLGNGTNTNSLLPAPITGFYWKSISAGGSHSMAIKTDNTLWAWGANSNGQLGNGTDNSTSVPTRIINPSGWKFAISRSRCSAGLDTNNTLWTWGDTRKSLNSPNPKQIGTDKDWTAIFSGCYHAMAIKRNNTLYAWGTNNWGQIGDNTTTDKASPVRISGNTWKEVALGVYHSIGIATNGTLWAWGANFSNQLGDTTIDLSSRIRTPSQISKETTWNKIKSCQSSNLALKTDGTLWGWGYNGSGQLGNGTKLDIKTPEQIGSENDWKEITMGTNHTLALKTDNSLWTWGFNLAGQLGDSTTIDKPTPIRIGTSNDWCAISAGSFHSLALKTDGTLWAWGLNKDGQLGIGRTDEEIIIVPVQVGADNDWKMIYAHENISFAIKNNGTLWGWGEGDGSGQEHHHGDDDDCEDFGIPTQIGEDTDWEEVAAGDYATFARKTDGTLWAWGWNGFGHLGTGESKLIPSYAGKECPPKTTIIDISKNTVSFTILPNPFYLIFRVISHSDEIKTIAVYDITGKEVKNISVKNHEAIITTENLNYGMYILKITTQYNVYVEKIVKR